MQAMTDSAQNNADSIHQTQPLVTKGSNIPERGNDWFDYGLSQLVLSAGTLIRLPIPSSSITIRTQN